MTESAGRVNMAGGDDGSGGVSGRLNESSSASFQRRRRSSAAAISRRRVSVSASRLDELAHVFLLPKQPRTVAVSARNSIHIITVTNAAHRS